MNSTFGARLRQQREERQVALTTISTKTKIKTALLEALESDDLSAWPKGLFGRAYLRDYATAVGLDAEALVSEFLTLHPEFAHVTPEIEEQEAAARDGSRNGAANKFRRFVSAAFSSKSPRVSIAPRPAPAPTPSTGLGLNGGHVNGSHEGRFEFDDMPIANQERVDRVDDVIEEAGPELLGASIPHLLAEAQERALVPFAELDAREEVVDSPEPTPFVPATTPACHREISLSAIADVCTRLARALDWREVTTLLAEAARLLDAVGVIVWQWDPRTTALRPSLSCGYSEAVVARLPGVRSDEANAVATAFRSGEQCIVDGESGTEAIVVPSLGVGGCVGVLAVELRPGSRERESVCAFTNILAAQLATLLPAPEPVEA